MKAHIMSAAEIEQAINTQAKNKEQFRDVFEVIDRVMELSYPNVQQEQGAMKACLMIHNYLLNRQV